jgi:ribosomal protein L37AE/L43A
MPNTPSIVNGPKLEVKKKIEYDIPCPKCNKEMRVTDVSEGALVECTDCGNVTWRIAYSPPWWAKTSRFLLSLLFSFIFGIFISLTAAWLYENSFKSGDVRVETNAPITKHKR